MKKVLLIAMAITLVAAGIAFAGVAGSLHDLGTGGAKSNVAGANTGQVCVFCHHPHRGQVSVGAGYLTNAILWNITDWSPTAYPVYRQGNPGTTMNATSVATIYNDGSTNAYASFFCMACHDGTIGANALVRPPKDGQQTTSYLIATAANLGTSLEDDHPVNFTVNTALVFADKELKTLTTTNNSWTSTALSADFPMFGGKMQCATCHDVHRGSLGTSCSAVGSAISCDPKIEFMLGSTINSQICVDCHIK